MRAAAVHYALGGQTREGSAKATATVPQPPLPASHLRPAVCGRGSGFGGRGNQEEALEALGRRGGGAGGDIGFVSGMHPAGD